MPSIIQMQSPTLGLAGSHPLYGTGKTTGIFVAEHVKAYKRIQQAMPQCASKRQLCIVYGTTFRRHYQSHLGTAQMLSRLSPSHSPRRRKPLLLGPAHGHDGLCQHMKLPVDSIFPQVIRSSGICKVAVVLYLIHGCHA